MSTQQTRNHITVEITHLAVAQGRLVLASFSEIQNVWDICQQQMNDYSGSECKNKCPCSRPHELHVLHQLVFFKITDLRRCPGKTHAYHANKIHARNSTTFGIVFQKLKNYLDSLLKTTRIKNGNVLNSACNAMH